MSINTLIYLSLIEYISNLKDTNGNAYFRTVNQDLGQLEIAPKPPVSFPCCLFDLDTAEWQTQGAEAQKGVLNIVFRLGFTPFSNSDNLTPADYRAKAVAYYDYEEILFKALQGWCPGDVTGYEPLQDIVGSLMRIRSWTERRPEDFIRVRGIHFQTTIDDYSAIKLPTLIQATAAINESFE